MTFKHVKFEDSPIMRSLEKVAKEKGMVKEEPIVKQAEQKQDLLPTHNFDLNLAKLCDGLRKAGMDKHADELETNFVNYKRAQTLYDAHGEKGEDLINAAHPKGSHHLEGVEGDEATVEDILDKHLKMVQMVNKHPTGKLAARDAITAVRIALGQAVAPKESEEQLYKEMNDLLNQMPTQIGAINSRVKRYGHSDWATIDKAKADELAQAVSSITTNRPFNRTNLIALKQAWSKYIGWASDTGAFENSIWHSSEHNDQSTALWENVGPYASNFTTAMWKVENRIKKLETIEFMKQEGTYHAPAPEVPKGNVSLPTFTRPTNEIVAKAYPLIQLCDQYKVAAQVAAPWLNDRQRNAFVNWLDGQKKDIQAIWQQGNTSDEGQYSQIKDLLMNRLNTLAAELQQGHDRFLVQQSG